MIAETGGCASPDNTLVRALLTVYYMYNGRRIWTLLTLFYALCRPGVLKNKPLCKVIHRYESI